MKTTEPNLLRDVLAERAAPSDTLGPLLRAVRTQRRRRQWTPVVALLLAGVLGWSFWTGPTDRSDLVNLAAPPVPVNPPAPVVVERVFTTALSAGERVTTEPGGFLVRVQTTPDPRVRVTDQELLAWAGGKGVGLFRRDGRMELMFARTH